LLAEPGKGDARDFYSRSPGAAAPAWLAALIGRQAQHGYAGEHLVRPSGEQVRLRAARPRRPSPVPTARRALRESLPGERFRPHSRYAPRTQIPRREGFRRGAARPKPE